jgi:hypothetical protein
MCRAECKVFDLDREDYSSYLKRALSSIGIPSESYDTHSGRIGGATMLWEGGASDAEIMEYGRWKSDSWKVYCRQVKSKCIKLSRLLSSSNLMEGSLIGENINPVLEIGI